MFQWSIPSKLADSFSNIMKFKKSYLEEMALHRDMRNGISHKIATILSKFSFLDMSNTFRQFHFFIIVSPFKKSSDASLCAVSSSLSTRELTSCLLAFSQLISGRAPDKRGADAAQLSCCGA